MKTVVIDSDFRAKLHGLTEQVVLADDGGRTVGVVLPPALYAEMVELWAGREPTEAEVTAARAEYREKGGRTTAEAIAFVRGGRGPGGDGT